MFVFLADRLLSKQMGSRFVLWLHLTVSSILEAIGLIFEVFFIFLELVVEDNVFLELVLVVTEKRVFDDVGEGHSFLAVHYEYSLEEIFQLDLGLLEFFLFAESCSQTKVRIATSSLDLSLHIVSCFAK